MKCGECAGRGTKRETLCYNRPPLGDAMFAATEKGAVRRAWPVREPGTFEVVEVPTQRACCRCGGTGEV